MLEVLPVLDKLLDEELELFELLELEEIELELEELLVDAAGENAHSWFSFPLL